MHIKKQYRKELKIYYSLDYTTYLMGGDTKVGVRTVKNYEISEVKAPSGYELSTETKTATVLWGETTEITFSNIRFNRIID